MSTLTIFSQRHGFVKDTLNSKIKLEPWMHIGVIELDDGKFGYAIWVWDSRQVIEDGEISKEQGDKIRFYITDHFFTNESLINDNYLPLKGGGIMSKAISKYFDEHYKSLINGIETILESSYEDAINELSNEPNKVELVKRIQRIFESVSTHEQRCVSIDSFKNCIKIRCNGGHDVAVMINDKLMKAGLKTELPNNSRFITVYFKKRYKL